MDSLLLNLIIWLPALGAVLIALIGRGQELPRWIALVASGANFLLSILLFGGYHGESGQFQFVTKIPWLQPALNSSYAIGVDGISIPLVVLNGLLSFLAVVISWNITLRPQLYFSLLMVLETAVMGVFSSLDLFLFFLFWELELVPMFLLISIWGTGRRQYSAIKFVLYTLAGSAFMLVGFLVLGLSAGTFDMQVLASMDITSAAISP